MSRMENLNNRRLNRRAVAGDPATRSKRGRPPSKPWDAVPRAIFVLQLMHRRGASLDDLNRDLLPPAAGIPPLGECAGAFIQVAPRPMSRRGSVRDVGAVSPRAGVNFERPLLDGADPTGRYRIEGSSKFTLADRAEAHEPGSEDWLLKPVDAYFRDELPPVAHASATIDEIASRLGLARLDAASMDRLLNERPDAVQELVLPQLRFLSQLHSPLHLSLLVAILHEQVWRLPRAADPTAFRDSLVMYRETCQSAFETLAKHPMMSVHSRGASVAKTLLALGTDMTWRVFRDGARSPRPPEGAPAPVSAAPLFIADRGELADAHECVSLSWAHPIERYLLDEYPPNAYFGGMLPSRADALRALEDLLKCTYGASDAAPGVLA